MENPHKKNIQSKDKGKTKLQNGSVIKSIQVTDSPARQNEENKSEDGGDTIM
jgi:hypothetical protein